MTKEEVEMRNDGLVVLNPQNNDNYIAKNLLITGLGRGGTTATAKMFHELGFLFESPNIVMETMSFRPLLKDKKYDDLNKIFEGWDKSTHRHAWKEPKLRSPQAFDFILGLPPHIGLVIVFRDLIATSKRNVMVSGDDFFPILENYFESLSSLIKLAKYNSSKRTVILISYEKMLVETENLVNSVANALNINDKNLIASAISSIEVSPQQYIDECVRVVKSNK